MNETQYDKLYKWQALITDSEATDDTCFLEFEKKMAEHGIRTRVLPSVNGSGYTLWIPQKDYEIANGFFTGAVKASIDVHKELYHVFEMDLSFKNKALYEHKYKYNFGKNRFRTYIFTGLFVLFLLLLAKFVNFN